MTKKPPIERREPDPVAVQREIDLRMQIAHERGEEALEAFQKLKAELKNPNSTPRNITDAARNVISTQGAAAVAYEKSRAVRGLVANSDETDRGLEAWTTAGDPSAGPEALAKHLPRNLRKPFLERLGFPIIGIVVAIGLCIWRVMDDSPPSEPPVPSQNSPQSIAGITKEEE